MSGAATTSIYLRAEGFALGVLCIWLYAELGHSWWIFAALFFVPDLSMLGYLRGPRVGAKAYNIVHSWALAVALFFVFWYFSGVGSPLMSLPIILGAHIGIDRALGYGLKLSSGFHDTDLGRIGNAA